MLVLPVELCVVDADFFNPLILQDTSEDADACLDYLLRKTSIPARNVFLLGRSIGSGPATYLARGHDNLAGLILESPFSSVDEAAAGSWLFRIYPVGLMLRTHFDNLSQITSVRIPLLIVSGTNDTLTPPSMAQRIFARANEPKQLYLIPHAGHNDLTIVGGKALIQKLRRFVEATP